MGPVTGFFFQITSASRKSLGENHATSTDNVIVRQYDAVEELLVELPEEEVRVQGHLFQS